MSAQAFQPLLAWVGRMKAWDVYRKASRDCPAYRRFLAEHKTPVITRSADLALAPITSKENYVKQYSIEDRCYGGRIPA
ncbi:MAG: CoF synthetase, partial [Tepidisphaeraceae bacterium]